jgi:hypothetical protein
VQPACDSAECHTCTFRAFKQHLMQSCLHPSPSHLSAAFQQAFYSSPSPLQLMNTDINTCCTQLSSSHAPNFLTHKPSTTVIQLSYQHQHPFPRQQARSPPPRRATSDRARSRSPVRRPEYAVRVPLYPFATVKRDYSDIARRYTHLSISPDFVKLVFKWPQVGVT